MTKQEQKSEFEKEYSKDDSFPRVEDITAFWLQKQDQLLTELGEILLKKVDEAYHLPSGDHEYIDICVIQKAINKYLINKYK